MRRTLVIGTLVVMVLAGCGWTQTDFDSGRSRADAFESKITAATAGTLKVHSFPLAPSALGVNPPALAAIVGNQIVTQQGPDVVAYDATTCPRVDGGACSPLWTRAGSRFRASDATHFVFTPGATGTGLSFEVTDAARNHLWDGAVPDSSAPGESLGFTSISLSGDKVVAGAMGGSHGSFAEDVSVFSLAGCGAATCGPLHTFANGNDTHGNRWVASGNTLVLNRAPTKPLGLYAFDMTTDAPIWSAPGDYELAFARIRGRDLFVSAANGAPPVFVYDLAGTTGCSGTPVVCTAVRTLGPAAGFVYYESTTGDRTIAFDSVQDAGGGLGTHSLSFFAADGTGCTSSPCGPLATSAPVTTWINEGLMHPVIAGDLVLALAIPPGIGNRTYHLLAYDAHLTAGCSGSPKVCRPVADVPITGQNDAQPIIAAVWNGRAYIQVANKVLVLSLPGDVG